MVCPKIEQCNVSIEENVYVDLCVEDWKDCMIFPHNPQLPRYWKKRSET